MKEACYIARACPGFGNPLDTLDVDEFNRALEVSVELLQEAGVNGNHG